MSIKRRIITLDVDGVIADFRQGFLRSVQRVFPAMDLSQYTGPTDWNFTDLLTPEQFKLAFDDVRLTRDFWLKAREIRSSTLALGLFLNEAGNYFDIYYLSSRAETRGGSALEQTGEWLHQRSLLKDNCSVIIVPESHTKRQVQEAIGAVASLDDYLPSVLASSGIDGHAAWLLDAPYNRVGRPEGLSVALQMRDFLNYLLQTIEYPSFEQSARVKQIGQPFDPTAAPERPARASEGTPPR